MAREINKQYIPFLFNHDRNNVLGVSLYGKVVELNDGEYALKVVSGIFETEDDRKQFKPGLLNTVWEQYQSLIPEKLIKKTKNQNTNNSRLRRYSIKSVARLLTTHLDSTLIASNGSVYKIKRYVDSTNGLDIHIYPNDHRPAHIHVKSKQRAIDVRIRLDTLEVLSSKRGNARKSDIKKIKNFFEIHRDILEDLKNYHSFNVSDS